MASLHNPNSADLNKLTLTTDGVLEAKGQITIDDCMLCYALFHVLKLAKDIWGLASGMKRDGTAFVGINVGQFGGGGFFLAI